jgi:F420-dependent oxidoreductase-like protein
MTAMTAATIDQLSDGRMLLGIGSSGPQVAEGWHGQRFARQLQRTREYVAVVRLALSRQRVEFHGETLELPLPDGPGKALKLTIAPVQESIPVYLAAIGPKNTTLAAEIADGWLPTLFSPEHVGEFRPLLEAGFARAGNGKGFSDFEIVPTVNAMVSDDLDSARDAMRHYIALYVGGMGSRKQNFYNALVCRYGFEAAAAEVQELYLAGRKDEAAASLPGELIDLLTLVGPAERVRERIGVYRDAGVATLMIAPMAWTFEDRLTQLRLVAELAA